MGCENQVRAVSHYLGDLPINGYYSFKLDDIGKLNHALGGVTVTLEEDFTHLDKTMKKGATLKLTDEQAEIYLHNRLDVGEGTNTGRMARQHQYMQNLIDSGMANVGSDIKYYYDLFEEIEALATTNLTGKQISRIAEALTDKEFKGLVTFEGKTKIGQALNDGIDHSEFYADKDSIVKVMTEMLSLEEEA